MDYGNNLKPKKIYPNKNLLGDEFTEGRLNPYQFLDEYRKTKKYKYPQEEMHAYDNFVFNAASEFDKDSSKWNAFQDYLKKNNLTAQLRQGREDEYDSYYRVIGPRNSLEQLIADYGMPAHSSPDDPEEWKLLLDSIRKYTPKTK